MSTKCKYCDFSKEDWVTIYDGGNEELDKIVGPSETDQLVIQLHKEKDVVSIMAGFKESSFIGHDINFCPFCGRKLSDN